MVQQHDTDQRPPEQRGRRPGPGHAPQATDQRRQQHRGGDEPGEPGRDRRDVPIGEQIRAELLRRGPFRVEKPSDMGV